MGREVLPQDKDYILDILDDVFFYIKQGSTCSPIQKPNSVGRISPMTSSLSSLNLSSSQASRAWPKIYREYDANNVGQIQTVLQNSPTESTSSYTDQLHPKLQFLPVDQLFHGHRQDAAEAAGREQVQDLQEAIREAEGH
jgi:hypothetical protein